MILKKNQEKKRKKNSKCGNGEWFVSLVENPQDFKIGSWNMNLILKVRWQEIMREEMVWDLIFSIELEADSYYRILLNN